MTFPVSQRRSPALTPCALACAISLGFISSPQVLAQNVTQALAPVVVTGARFASEPDLLPIGAIVISAAEIRQAGASDVNQAIRKIGGVYGRQSFSGSSDFDLDLRGFGTNSAQNVVVVVDGVRMSENEMSPAILSTIPIDSVERIEITRGGSSVLYGEGATGGVINVVTKRTGKRGASGSAFVEAGQFDQREVRASVAQVWDGFALDAAVGDLHTDNYRANNQFKQRNFSGGAQWNAKEGRIGLRIDSMRQDMRFPGGLTRPDFDADPRQAKENNPGSIDTDRLTAFIERKVGGFDLAAELSHREKTVTYDSIGFNSLVDSKQTQFSPRLRRLDKLDGLLNELVAGIDLAKWERVSVSNFSAGDATQKSKALYVHDEIKFNGVHNARLALGARHEIFEKVANDTAASNYNISQKQNAWDVQGSYSVLPKLSLYAKTGQSYRMANVDDNGYTLVTNQPLAAQTSHDLELGATVGDAAHSLTARVFRHKLDNEIFFDSNNFVNVNLDPTKRRGIEIDASTRVGADWRLSGHVQHVQASFTEGPNAGKEMVLVPKNILTMRLSWLPADGQSADIGAQWIDSQRNGEDLDNSCATRMPGFTTFDARYARKFGHWEVALTGLNLSDKQYYSYQYGCQTGIYPANGRQLKVSARHDF
jgi:iron complex outermembrane receptor protein